MLKTKPTFGQQCADLLFAMTDERRRSGQPVTRETLRPLFAEAIDRLDSERPKIGKAKRTKLEQSALFDALASACGIDPREITNGMGATIGTALADISSVSPELTSTDIDLRAARYRREHQGWPLTPSALAKYWGELGGGIGERKQFSPAVAEPDIPEPDGWREWVRENAVNPDNADRPWESFDKAEKAYIASQVGNLQTA